MNNVNIRLAQKQDCSQILALITQLAIYEQQPHAVTVTLAHFTQSGFGNAAIWTAYVAEVDGVIEGFALFYTRYSTWKGQMLYLEDFYVTPKCRKLGIGKQLFDATINYAKTNNLCGLTWQVLDWNQLAIDFYKKYNAIFETNWTNAKIFLDLK